MQDHITNQLVCSSTVKTMISQPSEVIFTEAKPRLTNTDVNLKIMHQLYNKVTAGISLGSPKFNKPSPSA